MYTRAEPYQGKANEFEGLMEGKILPEPHLLRKAYEEDLNYRGYQILGASGLTQELKGKFELALLVRRDGVLEDLSFIGKGDVKNRKLRRRVLQTLRSASPFPEFQKGLDTEKELFYLRFQFLGEPTLVEQVSQASETTAHESFRRSEEIA